MKGFDTRLVTVPIMALCAIYFGDINPWLVALIAVAGIPLPLTVTW